MATSLLDRAIYSYADVDRLVGLHAGTARRQLIVVTRDRRIRTRPVELRAYWEHGIRSVWIGAKQDLGPREQVELFLRRNVMRLTAALQ